MIGLADHAARLYAERMGNWRRRLQARGACGRLVTGRMRPVCSKCHEQECDEARFRGEAIAASRPTPERVDELTFCRRLYRWIERRKLLQPLTVEQAELVDDIRSDFLGSYPL